MWFSKWPWEHVQREDQALASGQRKKLRQIWVLTSWFRLRSFPNAESKGKKVGYCGVLWSSLLGHVLSVPSSMFVWGNCGRWAEAWAEPGQAQVGK